MKNTSLHSVAQARFFGLDVHQKTIVIAEAPTFGDPTYVKTLENTTKAVQEFFGDLCQDKVAVHTVYEAGGCGFGLARQLTEMGIRNLIAAPSKITRCSGEIKNDKRDAIKLARLLRNHVLMGHKELHEVYVPEPNDEAVREMMRQRNAFKRQVKVTQNQIMSMLRRYRFLYTLTKTAWTKTYRSWLERVDFGHVILNNTFREYLDQLADLEARVAKSDEAINQLCQDWSKAQIVKNLCALRGIQQLTAASLVAEIGVFSRFESASLLMGYIGLTPSEFSSGESVTRGRISKTGNTRVRTLLVEASCCASRKPKSQATFMASCPPGASKEVCLHAYKAQCRLSTKYWRLVNRGKSPNVAKIAVARELLGFIWAIAIMIETQLDQQPTQKVSAA